MTSILPDDLAASLAERYTLEHEIASGGMATVHLATDRKHDRRVAIKLMRPEVAAAIGSERFLREIAVVARLSHPHILPLFDSGQAGANLYYVTPFVEGGSLRDRLRREGRLNVDAALSLVRQVAAALEYAHRHGVIHRDIKPENILLHESEALLCDFGIARAEFRADRITTDGIALGTPKYMSPEQAFGGADVDARTDIFSLGCVLYEALVGEAPFEGPSARAVAQRLNVTPPSARAARDGVPLSVDYALQRALAPRPGDRYSSVSEFVEALITATRPQRRTVAILPFQDFGAEPDNEHLAEGITEDLIAQLAKIRDVGVIARSSVLAYRDTHAGVREIGRALGVAAVLTGSVRRAGRRIRVNAQLIDAESEQHLWGERYDRELLDIFEIQGEIAERIASALASELSPDERQRIRAPQTRDSRAYELFQRGRFHTNKYSATGWQKGLALLEEALALDHEYAAPHATLSLNYAVRAFVGAMPAEEAFARAEEEARVAIALDDAESDAHLALAYAHYFRHWDWAAARREFERALALSPGNSHARSLYGVLLDTVGEHAASMRERLAAYELNPVDAISAFNVGYGHLVGGDTRQAIRYFRRALEVEPGNLPAWYGLGMAQAREGDAAAACATFERLASSDETNTATLGFLGWAYAVAGKREAAEQVRSALTSGLEGSYVSPFHLALTHLGLGDVNAVFACLDQALAERAMWMPWLRLTPPLLALREDPRFRAIEARMGLPAVIG